MVDEISESQEELLRRQPFLNNPLPVPIGDQRSPSSSESLPRYVVTDYPEGIFMRSVSGSSDSYVSAESMDKDEGDVEDGVGSSGKEIIPAVGNVFLPASREKNVLSTLEEKSLEQEKEKSVEQEEEEKRDEIQPMNDGPEGESALRKLPVSLEAQRYVGKDTGRVRLPVRRNLEESCVASVSNSVSEDASSPEDARKLVCLLEKVIPRRKRSGDMDILQAAAIAGMNFDPPRWWRTGGYGEKVDK